MLFSSRVVCTSEAIELVMGEIIVRRQGSGSTPGCIDYLPLSSVCAVFVCVILEFRAVMGKGE